MRRLLAVAVCCLPSLFAQARNVLVDATVVDTAGHPVADLTAADFQVTEAGQPLAIDRLTAFDTVRHTAMSPTAVPALALTPDQIHRTIVIVVDDLCLTQTAIEAARKQIYRVLETQLVPGDRLAILRSSGGSPRDRQLNAERKEIERAIQRIEYLGGVTGAAACGAAAWLTVSHAIHGLAAIDGRKMVVLMSGDLPAPNVPLAAEIQRVAAASATTLYQTSANAPSLSAATGGAARLELQNALEEQRAFYVLGFGSSGAFSVALRRPGLTLRTRRGPIPPPAAPAQFVPDTPSGDLRDALTSPFEGSDIALQVTPLFSTSQAGAPLIEIALHIDARDLSYLRDSTGKHHIEFDVHLSNVLESGSVGTPTSSHQSFDLSPEEYSRATSEGIVLPFQLQVISVGPRQLRVAVTEPRSGRTGSATASVETHDPRKNVLFLSGVALQGSQPTVKNSMARRIFRPGDTLFFGYNVFHPTPDAEGHCQVEAQTRLFAGGHEVFHSEPATVNFDGPASARSQINGKLTLDRNMSPGHIVLVVSVTDKLSKEPRSAGQFIDFIVEQ